VNSTPLQVFDPNAPAPEATGGIGAVLAGVPWPIVFATIGLLVSLSVAFMFWRRGRLAEVSDTRVRHDLEVKLGIGREESALLRKLVSSGAGAGDPDTFAVRAMVSSVAFRALVERGVESGAVEASDLRLLKLCAALGRERPEPGSTGRSGRREKANAAPEARGTRIEAVA